MKIKNRNSKWLPLFLTTLMFFGVNAAVADETGTGKTPHQIPKITSKIKIDGVITGNEWKDALMLELKYEISPGDNIKPPVKTELYLGYSSSHLYVAFKAYDPDPSKIRAHFTDRDNIWSNDYVAVVLDTFNDSRRAFNFSSNPYGIQGDEIVSTVGFGAFDGIWNSAGKINKEGYIVEMSIPFTSLRFQHTKEDQVWKIIAMRFYPRNVLHQISLVPLDRNNDCFLCQFTKVTGFKGAKPGLNLEFDPTLFSVMTRERESFPDGKFVKKTGKVDPGLTARWSFTPNLTLSAAVNPDFSQVEADAAQLDVNTQFALFYEEKRPFFLEGGTIFNTLLNPIYSRSVADPDWGVKLTGKEGKHAVAFFTAQDHVTNLIFPSSQGSFPQAFKMSNQSTALRYRFDMGRASNMGVVLTDREGDDYFNRVAGIDGDFWFTKSDRITFQFLGSQTRYPGDIALDYGQSLDKFSGSAMEANYSHKTRNLTIYGQYKNVHPDFRADVGFINQADYILYRGGGEYLWRKKPGYWYTQITAGGGYLHNTDRDNNLLSKSVQAWLYYKGGLQSNIQFDVSFGKRTYLDQEFNDNKMFITAWVRPSGSFLFYTGAGFGDQIDFANVRSGKLLNLNPLIRFNWGHQFYLQLSHIYERLNVTGGRLYSANLSDLNLTFHFSPRIFLRTILQYVDYQYNSALYSDSRDPEYKNLFSQVLFSYKLNPKTVLFLGYSDESFGYSDIPMTRNNYTFFLKIGYALVF
ncbi:MAG: carbohydrate binding family 9 domain-containing protein [bacterium]|nr:carbohydrate binding family 9 domain-containing protein [bacterium]